MANRCRSGRSRVPRRQFLDFGTVDTVEVFTDGNIRLRQTRMRKLESVEQWAEGGDNRTSAEAPRVSRARRLVADVAAPYAIRAGLFKDVIQHDFTASHHGNARFSEIALRLSDERS